MPPARSRSAALGAEILSFLLAATCAGCDRPGMVLCDDCRTALRASPRHLRTPAGLPVTAALLFDGIPARCLRRLKDAGETMLARPLGIALGAAIDQALRLDGDRDVVLVPVPTSRAAFRRRGYRVPDLLLARASTCGATTSRILRSWRGHADQRGLDASQRADNVRGTMRVTGRLPSTAVVLVDDVMTTGATFDEAAATLRRAGVRVRGAVALAATPLHSERRADASATRSK